MSPGQLVCNVFPSAYPRRRRSLQTRVWPDGPDRDRGSPGRRPRIRIVIEIDENLSVARQSGRAGSRVPHPGLRRAPTEPRRWSRLRAAVGLPIIVVLEAAQYGGVDIRHGIWLAGSPRNARRAPGQPGRALAVHQRDDVSGEPLQALDALRNGLAAAIEDQLVHADCCEGSNVAGDLFRLAAKEPAGSVRRCNAGVIERRLVGVTYANAVHQALKRIGCATPPRCQECAPLTPWAESSPALKKPPDAPRRYLLPERPSSRDRGRDNQSGSLPSEWNGGRKILWRRVIWVSV